jgi:hydroxymethylpyrimidine pyrophosphatase-like HAD family hydrolase
MHHEPVILFISDIDGCISEPYRPYELESMVELAKSARFSDGRSGHPRLTLCSGRPSPYVEAMTQVLGVTDLAIFESGGGLLDPVSGELYWNPIVTEEHFERIEEVKRWLGKHVAPVTALNVDHAKRTQAGVVGPSRDDVYRVLPGIEEYVRIHHPEYVVYHTDASIDVLPPGLSKRQSLSWLSDLVGIDLTNMAFIGDSNGDIEALSAAGFSFAPANASSDVLRVVDRITHGSVLIGMREAYDWCAEHNRRLANAA